MPVTYRFEYRADRSDGKSVIVAPGAAVYNTVEEALLQAGFDLMVNANPHPVDIIDGAEHGYDRSPYDVEDPKVLASAAQIKRASKLVAEFYDVTPHEGVRRVQETRAPRDGRRASTATADDHAEALFDQLRDLA